MTAVSDDPTWWPLIGSNIFSSYWIVACGVVVVYDWALTLEQEIELIWRQRWSLMTALYLVIRYIGMPHSVVYLLAFAPFVSLTDAGCNIMYFAWRGTGVVVSAMLGVIMIARLYAMYQRSRRILIFLVIIFLTVNIAGATITAIGLKDTVTKEMILSGTYMCDYEDEGNSQLPSLMLWILNTIWEVLALCLSVWIAVKHFRELRQFGPSTGSTIGDCFRVLVESHVLYFASFVCVSCLMFVSFSPKISQSHSMGTQTLNGALSILMLVQMFVLGPRLILSVREYHATLVFDSDAEISMKSIVFQERIDVPTSSTV